jgi:hypothetical protein
MQNTFAFQWLLSTHTHTWYKYCIGITPEKLLYSLSYEWKSTKTQVTIMNVMSPIAPLVPVLHPNFVTVFASRSALFLEQTRPQDSQRYSHV